MPRKKQSRPRGNVGPVEARRSLVEGDVAEPSEPGPPDSFNHIEESLPPESELVVSVSQCGTGFIPLAVLQLTPAVAPCDLRAICLSGDTLAGMELKAMASPDGLQWFLQRPDNESLALVCV